MLRKMYDWCVGAAGKPYATWPMGAVSFVESSFFPIPPDAMLIPMSLARPDKAYFYATVCTVTSVAGGVLGYAIGYYLYESFGLWLIQLYGYGDKVEAFREAYEEWGAWIILLKGADADPLQDRDHRVGLRRTIRSLPFILLSFIARGMRFYLVAFLLHRYGDRRRASIIEERLGFWVTIAAVVLVAGIVARDLSVLTVAGSSFLPCPGRSRWHGGVAQGGARPMSAFRVNDRKTQGQPSRVPDRRRRWLCSSAACSQFRRKRSRNCRWLTRRRPSNSCRHQQPQELPAEAAPPPSFRPGFIDALGRWLGDRARPSRFAGQAPRKRLERSGAARPTSPRTRPAPSSPCRARGSSAAASVARRPPTARRTASRPSTRSAAARDSRPARALDSREAKCPAKVCTSGRAPQDGECRLETYVTRAVCQ